MGAEVIVFQEIQVPSVYGGGKGFPWKCKLRFFERMDGHLLKAKTLGTPEKDRGNKREGLKKTLAALPGRIRLAGTQ